MTQPPEYDALRDEIVKVLAILEDPKDPRKDPLAAAVHLDPNAVCPKGCAFHELAGPDALAATAAHLWETYPQAMLDAGVRAGALSEERRTLLDGMAGMSTDPEGNWRIVNRPSTQQRRLVTVWEVIR